MHLARSIISHLAILGAALITPASAGATHPQYTEADGLAVYLGFLPAAVLRGHPVTHAERGMHGGIPGGAHAYHVTVAVFEAGSGTRVEEAVVEARVSSLGLTGPRKRLDPMAIAGTITYGNYFDLPGAGSYRIRIWIARPGQAGPLEAEFAVEHPAPLRPR